MSVKVKVIIIVSIIAVLGISYKVLEFYFFPKIILKGDSTITLNYKQPYKELGYVAKSRMKNLTSRVKVRGKVNSNKLGNYKIKYKVHYGKFSSEVTRVVKVRDTEKPLLSFENDQKDIYICPGKSYEKEKVKAYDNYDLDITDNVKVTVKKDNVTYSVVDSSGNYVIKKKKLIYKDIEKPKLELKNEDQITIFVNDKFNDPGYVTSDNCDDKLDSEVEGTVDTSKVGSYSLTYKVRDKSGNEAVAHRIVKVIKKGSPGSIYLTFDDGPHMGTTNVILDILKQDGVKATFFVTNNGPDELIVREYKEGHSIGMHSATHQYAWIYSSVDSYFQDLALVHDRILSLTGYDSRIVRFPGGSSNTISRKYKVGIMSELANQLQNKNYAYYDWTINSGDTDGLTEPSEIYNRVISNLSKSRSNVILMHDTKSYTRDALKQIIDYGKAQGYYFDTITFGLDLPRHRINN